MKEDLYYRGTLKNDKLLSLLKEVRYKRSTEAMTEAIKEAFVSQFILPIISKDNGVSFSAIGDKKGRKFLVVYTDTTSFEVLKANDDDKAILSSFDDIMMLALDEKYFFDGIIINPGQEEILLSSELLSMVSKGIDRNDVSVLVGEPDKYPKDLVPMAREYLSTRNDISRVYVRLIKEVDKTDTSFLFVVDMDGDIESKRYFYDIFNRYMNKYLDGMNSITVGIEEEFLGDSLKDVDPIYEKNERNK